MGNKKATGFLCLRLVPCFAYVGAEDNRKGIPFVKIVSLLCKLIQFLMVALSVTVHKALILLVFLNHPYQSLAFTGFSGISLLVNSRPKPANFSWFFHLFEMGERFWGVLFQNFLKKFFANKKPPISLVIEVNRRRVELFMFLVYAGRIIHVFGV